MMLLAKKYCQGHGIELGAAAHNAFNLAHCLNVAPCNGVDFLHPRDMEDYQQYFVEQMKVSGDVSKVDMLGDFQCIHTADSSVDYLISSHVIEHVPNLLSAYVESFRVLKNGGVFFCIFPKRTAAKTDRARRLTTLAQMIEDYENKVDMTTVTEGEWRGHYQVFSLQSMLRAVNYVNSSGLGCWYIECVEETDSKVGNGHTVVLRKVEGLSAEKWQDVGDFNTQFNQLLMVGKLENALTLTKIMLSFNFFDATRLHLAGALSRQLGNVAEGVEFLRQALVVDPENEDYRKEFIEVTGTPFHNPVL
ncbi:hypothetical protein Pav013_3449 [Pseudomonas syringae pv. avellanae str. ISPaVe013]|nr:hypothetical protein Pav013_3449 [Pseudomonas syringae pv. avellanae str. ISPaVe013]